MADITDFMSADHRRCDDEFAAAETAVDKENWEEADDRLTAFVTDTERHFRMEEEVLFPAFEEATGMTMGPTQVMRMEHQQMRQLMEDMKQALADRARDTFLGYSETMLMLMQQHNAKEEQMLYQMADQSLAGKQEQLIARMSAL